MKYRAIILVAVALAVFATPVESQDSPCAARAIKICEKADGGVASICRILKQDDPETPRSIYAFLASLGQLSESVRQDMICARLMGLKRVNGIISSVNGTSDRNYFPFRTPGLVSPSRTNRWFLALNDGRYAVLAAKHAKLASLNKPASLDIRFDFVGTITFVYASYDGYQKLTFYEIHAQSVDLFNIITPHAHGDLDDQIEALEVKITAAYKEYMQIGLEAKGTPPPEPDATPPPEPNPTPPP